MNRIKILIVIAAAAVLISCTTPLSSRIAAHVDKVEKSYKEWDTEDWAMSKKEYKALLKEYKENYNSFSAEEKAEINKAIGRYNGLLVKEGLEDVGGVLEDFGQRIPSLIEGFVSAFEDNDKN